MEPRDELERARLAIGRCRKAAARARAALERARDNLARMRADTGERILRAETAGTVAEVALQRAADASAPHPPVHSAGRGAA